MLQKSVGVMDPQYEVDIGESCVCVCMCVCIHVLLFMVYAIHVF